MNPHRLWAIARKEALQLRRDTRSLVLAFLLPLALILFFGYDSDFLNKFNSREKILRDVIF